MNHTPGPWFADKLQDQNAYNIFPSGATHALVTVSASAGAPLSHSVAVAANARLIASAPALLAALYEIANYDPAKWDAATLGNIARAAISHATGE